VAAELLLPTASAHVTADAPVASTDASLTLASVGSDERPAGAASPSARVAAGGRYVAFQSFASLPVDASVAPSGSDEGSSRVYVRDAVGNRTTLLSDPRLVGGVPDIAANGRLVSYASAVTGDIYVTDRRATGKGGYDSPGNLVVRPVTNTSRELSYERLLPCPSGDVGTTQRITPCGPRLSADGTTLVYPAVRDPQGSTLLAQTQVDSYSAVQLPGDLLDFTPFGSPDGYGVFDGTNPTDTATVSYLNTGTDAVHLTGVALAAAPQTDLGDLFAVAQNSCTGVLAPQDSCTVRVGFDRSACADLAAGRPHLATEQLITRSPTPAGQSQLQLGALCYRPNPYETTTTPTLTGAAAPACPAPPAGLDLHAVPTGYDNQEAPLADVGAVDIGRPRVVWKVLTAPTDSFTGTATVRFTPADSADCAQRLVDPATLRLLDPLPSSAPPPCFDGETLTSSGSSSPPPGTDLPPSSCTAYVLVQPGTLRPDVALLSTEYFPYTNSGFPAVAPDAYFTSRGTSSIVVARRDPSGAGKFAASTPSVVNVDAGGAVLPGATQPVVSANGRYVAFAAPVPIGRAGQQSQPGVSQVWRHDTDARGNRTFRPGATVLMSCLPTARPVSCPHPADADSPSLSADAAAVAFATTGAVPLDNGFGEGGGGQPPPVSASQVYVRGGGRTTLVSTTRRSTAGNGISYAPDVSADGTEVAFVSQAGNLSGQAVAANAANVYVRRLSPHGRGNDLLSASGGPPLPNTVPSPPSIDAHGRLVAFPSTARLLPAAPSSGEASVYTAELLPHLGLSPAQARFGRVLLHSGRHAITVTVANDGPGPGTITGVRVPPPFQVDDGTCAGSVVYPGTACRITVVLLPDAPGSPSGTGTIAMTDDGEAPIVTPLAVGVFVPTPAMRASPDVGSGGDATTVRGSGFPPGHRLTLRWSLGLGAATATPAANGTFVAVLVVFPKDVIGPRAVVAAGASGRLATAPFLVEAPSQEPPFHGPG
jgi:hypothetical protein